MKSTIHCLQFCAIAIFLSSCASSYLVNGEKAYDAYRYQEAIFDFEKGLKKKDDARARLMLAESYMKVNQFGSAMKSYELAVLGPELSDKDRLDFGRALMSQGQYEKAYDIFDGILSRSPGHAAAQALKTSCKNHDEMVKDSAMFSLRPVTIGGVTSAMAPHIFKDGVLFSSKSNVHKGVKDPYTGQTYLDLFSATTNGSNIENAKRLENINGKYHDGFGTISGDGQTMILTRSNYLGKSHLGMDEKYINNTQLYISKKNSEGNWSIPSPLPFNDPKYMFAHPTLTQGGNQLIFSSDQSGGQGGMDLYASSWNGVEWTKPVNLGPEINSMGDDVFANYKNADTLYFSSDSHLSAGGLDILYSVNRENSWSAPYHLSYPINSSQDDFGLTFNPDGTTGFLSSDRSGADMIYTFEMFNPDLQLRGLMADLETLQPIEGVKITVDNITDGISETYYTDENGVFTSNLAPGKNYRITAEDPDYFAISKDLSTIGKTADELLDMVFEMQKLVVQNETGDPDGTGSGSGITQSADGTYPVPNIYWDYNKWEIRPDAEPYLNNLAKLLKDNKNLKVQINSHCDCRGSHAFNDDLSKKRATEVVDYLIKKGIARSMMKSKGYGERRLKNKCRDGIECSEDEHQENRRTEFIVTERK